ncbi:hypothetical protein Nepgr_022405 [Nepenthes gracilis]|uniref:Cupin type-1 domain-containing protein n=1 Tax=Nepenthes gracilis TaxID=150966 RepID=A0AAD3XY18_NEPGR|nr:hypothetical protein Nepgr_022405 [Nepenthes gracilis]
MEKKVALRLALVLMASYVAYATDPTQLQDFCVGINNPIDGVFVNGLFCKNPVQATPNDFLFKGLNIPGNTNNKLGSNVTLVSAANLPGLNTLGISLARIDYAPYGLIPPHTHPRGTEIFTVLEGTSTSGFVTSNLPNSKTSSSRLSSTQRRLRVFPLWPHSFSIQHWQDPRGHCKPEQPKPGSDHHC